MTTIPTRPTFRADPARDRRIDDQAAALRRLVESVGGGRPAFDAESRAGATIRPSRSEPCVAAESPPRPLAHAVAVASGKGGVGKSNICVNLCVSLARAGVRATLLDADLGLANADVLCNVSARRHLGHVIEGAEDMRSITVEAPGGFRLAPGVPGGVLVRADDALGDNVADLPRNRLEPLVRALAALESSSDVLVIDCGAGIGRVVRSFLRAADHALIVTTPEPTSIADAYALIKSVLTSEAGREPSCVELVVNQAMHEREALEVHGRIDRVCERFLGRRIGLAGWAPQDKRVPESVRAREPFSLRHPNCGASKRVAALAAHVREQFGMSRAREDAGRGFVRRLLGV